MATQTLAQAKLLINNEIVRGVAEDIITLNPIFSMLPFVGYEGQGLIINRELTLGGTSVLAVAGAITSTLKTASTFTQKVVKATKLIGDAEMDGLVQAQSVGAGVDQLAIEISAKAKSIGRLFQTGMATGTGSSPQMNSFRSECDATQYASNSTSVSITFALIDELLDLVTIKDGQVDFMIMPARTMRAYKVLLRSLGGVPADWVVNLPDGRTTIGYEGIPIFKNEYLDVKELLTGATNSTTTWTSVYAGCFDDGSQKVGIAGIHPIAVPAGISVEPVGAAESYDMNIWRVKQYANFACFNRKGLARLKGIKN
jgi:hypothetical protein